MALTYVVDGYGLLLRVLRDRLPPDEWLVQTRIPNDIPSLLAQRPNLLVIRRTGGGVERNFHGFMERWLTWCLLWYPAGEDMIPKAQLISTILFEAWSDQVVTPYGHIAHCRNGVGWEDESDPELPLYGRATAQYEYLLRPPRPTP